MISNIVFTLLLGTGIYLFSKKIGEVRRNILLGRDVDLSDRSSERWMTMIRVALGQSKMGTRPVAAFFHLLIYVGFIIINIEVLEIIIDGIFGTHRVLSFMGGFYDFLIGSFEFLALGVLAAAVVFLARRNITRVARLNMQELDGWPRNDANLILITEVLLMSVFFTMNATDQQLQALGAHHYIKAG